MDLVQSEAVLETSRLWLEPLYPSHALALYEPLQSPAIYEFLPENPPTSSEALTTRYQRLSSRRSPDGQEIWLNWAMRQRRETVYVGLLQASVYPDETAYLAYMLFPPFWRQGYAREGCQRVLDLLFKDYQVHLIVAEIDTRNAASITLIESLGFQRVATKLNADVFKGSTSHEYRYELLFFHESV
ncbi:GNAT family N-acetyltransferase [Ktedonospora formicarum]|uniref:Acetyltransferase n=1 Tax=Ktedonospora formicarum TaxID=2778364 RepID=A0A8J3MTN7_9CHLR|nr:GNAT family N-acetyltransferase [Ktedonospora formicarum]GHO45793.1 acetyltransferase [Ktedonospora formicarum]